MPKKFIPGKIIIPKNTSVYPYEFVVATALSMTGHDVEFIPVRRIPTPDILFMNLEWEIKSPTGSSSRTIENNMRNALKQSRNIIVDLSRIKYPEEKCLREIRRQTKVIRGINKVIVITRAQKMIKIC